MLQRNLCRCQGGEQVLATSTGSFQQGRSSNGGQASSFSDLIYGSCSPEFAAACKSTCQTNHEQRIRFPLHVNHKVTGTAYRPRLTNNTYLLNVDGTSSSLSELTLLANQTIYRGLRATSTTTCDRSNMNYYFDAFSSRQTDPSNWAVGSTRKNNLIHTISRLVSHVMQP